MLPRLLPLLLALVLAAGCQSTPGRNDTGGFTPADAIVDAPSYKGRDVVWGGTLIATTNRKEDTMLELLSYPVVNGRPQTSAASQGRVLAKVPGFLDPAEYRPGRPVVVEGLFTGVRHGSVGGASTTYAVVEARKATLGQTGRGETGWPPNLHIGIGVFKRL